MGHEASELVFLCGNSGISHRMGIQKVLSEREMFYLTKHSTHFIYGYMASESVKRAMNIGYIVIWHLGLFLSNSERNEPKRVANIVKGTSN